MAGLQDKLAESRKADRAASAEGCALVVRSTALALAKQQKAKEWLAKSEGIKLRSTSSSAGGAHHSSAYGEGKEDGRRANVSAARKSKLDGSTQRRLN